jgi:hypothetical protein
MSMGQRVYWTIMGAAVAIAYVVVWANAWSAKHALDVAMSTPPPATAGKVLVTYLFHPGDCPDASEVIDALDSLSAAGHRVSGLMITNRGDGRDIGDVARAYRIRFPVKPVAPREAGLVLGALRYTRTPLAIVRDSSGAIRMLIPGRAPAPTATQILSIARS